VSLTVTVTPPLLPPTISFTGSAGPCNFHQYLVGAPPVKISPALTIVHYNRYRCLTIPVVSDLTCSFSKSFAKEQWELPNGAVVWPHPALSSLWCHSDHRAAVSAAPSGCALCSSQLGGIPQSCRLFRLITVKQMYYCSFEQGWAIAHFENVRSLYLKWIKCAIWKFALFSMKQKGR